MILFPFRSSPKSDARNRRPRQFAPTVDALDKRIAPGTILPPPPIPPGTCDVGSSTGG